MSYFHKNLRFLMLNQNETQESVAKNVGVSQGTVSNWRNSTMPGEEKLWKIAGLFGITVDELVNQELPHKRNIEALTELGRELEELRTSWIAVAARLKERAAKSAERRDYSNAVQNDWMGSGMESCANDLSKVLNRYFLENEQTPNVNPQPRK